MAIRIDVQYRTEDGRILTFKKKFEKLGLSAPITELYFANSYTIDIPLTASQIKLVTRSLINPELEEGYVHPGVSIKNNSFDWVIEIGFLPGVTDNVSNPVQENIKDLLQKKIKPNERVYSSDILYIKGKLSEEDINKQKPLGPFVSCEGELGVRGLRETGFGVTTVDATPLSFSSVPNDARCLAGTARV